MGAGVVCWAIQVRDEAAVGKVQFVANCSHADTLEYISGLWFLSYILSFCTFVDFQDMPYARFVTPYTGWWASS